MHEPFLFAISDLFRTYPSYMVNILFAKQVHEVLFLKQSLDRNKDLK